MPTQISSIQAGSVGKEKRKRFRYADGRVFFSAAIYRPVVFPRPWFFSPNAQTTHINITFRYIYHDHISHHPSPLYSNSAINKFMTFSFRNYTLHHARSWAKSIYTLYLL